MDVLLDFLHRVAPWAFAGLLISAAVSDATSYIIPNGINAAVALLFPVYAFTGPISGDFLGSIIVAVVVLVVAGGLFAANLMGGGDVKLMAATALWAGTTEVLTFVLLTAIAGGALSLLVLLKLRIAAATGRMVATDSRRVPYGLAIAFGGLYVASRLIGF